MFLIKHIVSRAGQSIMNSSSAGEKAAVWGSMGNLSSVLQREDTGDWTNAVLRLKDET